MKEINLENIEPFTLVLFQNQALFQLRWNGIKKETLELDIHKNHVWSSSTLYPEVIRKQRADWFYTFLEANPVISKRVRSCCNKKYQRSKSRSY